MCIARTRNGGGGLKIGRNSDIMAVTLQHLEERNKCPRTRGVQRPLQAACQDFSYCAYAERYL